MAGLVGIIARCTAGRPSTFDIGGMLASISHRGPDGVSSKLSEGVALGQAWLLTSARATVPNGVVCLDNLIIVADCRLDDTDTLRQQLGAQAAMSDVELILLAYRRWGKDCVAHLEGDFAFAIWDADRQSLFCARDRFGVKPFYYYFDGQRFVFASEIRAVLSVGGVPQRLSEEYISSFLAGFSDPAPATPFKNILRLPAHHTMMVTGDRVELDSYWELAIKPRTAGRDSAEEFRELFRRSVEQRLGDGSRVGAMLSGGLDSSSICTVGEQILSARGAPSLQTFSMTFEPGSSMDESAFIHSVLGHGEFDATLIPVSDYAPFAELRRIVVQQDGTFLAPGLTLSQRLFETAASKSVRVLLDGHGGDEVVSHGFQRLNELASQGRLLSLWRESAGVASLHGQSGLRIFADFYLEYAATKPVKRMAGLVRRLYPSKGPASSGSHWRAMIRQDLCDRTDLVARFGAAAITPRHLCAEERLAHHWTLTSSLVEHSFEVLDKAAGHSGIEPRYPFWDQRLVEFCLSLPSEDKLDGGWTRLILRKAMQGILPEDVQWRRDKIDFTPILASGMLAHHRAAIGRVLGPDADRIAPYVNLDVVRASYMRLEANPGGTAVDDLMNVWRSVVLSEWLSGLEEDRVAA